jgi:hypothetical protein
MWPEAPQIRAISPEIRPIRRRMTFNSFGGLGAHAKTSGLP